MQRQSIYTCRSLPALPQRLTSRPNVSVALPRKAPLSVQASASIAAAAATPASSDSPAWPGAKPLPLILSIAIGLVIRFVVPCPAGITLQGWTLLSIFVSTIAGLVLEPLPVGAWAFISATTAIATKTLTFPATFTAFTNDVIWLIVVSFFFARVRYLLLMMMIMIFHIKSKP